MLLAKTLKKKSISIWMNTIMQEFWLQTMFLYIVSNWGEYIDI